MTNSLTFKPKKNHLLYWIRKVFNNKTTTNKNPQIYTPSEEELLEFEKWCSLQ